MGIFNDPSKLFNMSFPWALGRYRRGVDDDQNQESPPPDIDSLSVYVDEGGDVNIDAKLRSYSSLDPFDVPFSHTYSQNNNFIAQLNRTLTTVPIGALILFPTYNPRSAITSPRRYWFANIAPRYQGRLRYPNDTPPGFVPCIGQVLSYPDGSLFQVAEMAPPVTSWGSWNGGRLGGGWGGSFAPGYSFLPTVRYLQRVPEGWVEDPIGSGYLDEIKPDRTWRFWFRKGG